jgi:radical SAM superfamily enzyme YgiQ (UPF0313 family)
VEDFLREASEIGPDIVLMESATPTFNLDLKLLAQLRQRLPKAMFCVSGPHVTIFPKEALAHPEIDFVFREEYELGFTQFVDVWSRTPAREKSVLGGIPGIAFMDAKTGEYVAAAPKQIEDLDALPFPKREIFPSNKAPDMACYWPRTNPKPAIQMHASRGCPFRCTFCLWIQVMYDEGKYRVFSPARIVDEMEYLKKTYGISQVYFDDDTFTGNRKHVLDLCDELRRRNTGLTWSAMGDLVITNEEMLEAMAASGCTFLKFGVESGDPEVIKTVGKPLRLEKVERMAKVCSRLGIQTHATFMFGLLEDTKESIRRTFEFSKRLDVDSVQFSINTPFPGTKAYREAQARGLLTSDQWEHFDGGQTSVLRLPNVERAWLEEFLRHALSGWLRSKIIRPQWVLRQIRYFRRTEKLYGQRIMFDKFKLALRLLGWVKG